jgi:uncharacterized membrane protein YraQ (UPF0718 family)
VTLEPIPPLPPIKRRKRKPFDWSTAGIGLLVTVAATFVFVRDGRERFLEILYSDLSLFGGMLLKVLAGCLIGAFVARLLPGGPVTIYPVASAFLLVGADVGATIAFITSWTLLGYTRALVWELPFFGLDFVIWRTIVALPLPIIAGLLARVLSRKAAARWGDNP